MDALEPEKVVAVRASAGIGNPRVATNQVKKCAVRAPGLACPAVGGGAVLPWS